MMQFIDFSPQTSPSLNQQRDALQKGLGRTWIWASSDALADAPLLEACLQDKRFDQQCEDSRSNWLWKIVQRIEADESDLRSILVALWAADEPNVISRLLRVFSNRSLPEFDFRLIELCQHDDKEVQRSAFKALSKNADAAIRGFALQQLAIEATGPVISLFTENFEIGDEERILESMSLPDDPCELHWLLMDVIKVLESNPKADCSRLGVVTYGSTPCQNCRVDAARLLHRQEAAPVWLIEECRFDAEELCRQLFEGPASE